MEVAEEALLILFKSPGAHVLCNVITATLTAAARQVQITTRAFRFSRHHGGSGVYSLLAIAHLSRMIRKAQERVVFSSLPLDLSDSDSTHLNKAISVGSSRAPMRLEGDKRERFVNWLTTRLDPIDQEIRELKEQQPLGILARHRIKKLESQREKLQTLRRKVFEGRRYKRFFLLFSRKGNPKSLATDEGFAPRLRGRFLWVIAAEVGTFDPYMGASMNFREAVDEMDITQNLAAKSLETDPIRREIAASFVEDHEHSDPAYVAEVLNDISVVFDPSVSKAQKYLLVRSLEAVVGSLLLATSKEVNDSIWDWAVAKEALSGKKKLSSDMGFWWRRGTLTRYFDQYFDFLRVVSVSRGGSWSDCYWLQYDAMEYFLEMMKVLQVFNGFRSLEGDESSTQVLLDELQQRRKRLEDSQFWIPKRRHFNWVPLRKRPPRCEQLGAA
jgi:hypothetical protein